MRKYLMIAGISATHLVISIGFFLLKAGEAMNQLDTGVSPTSGDLVIRWISDVLLYPIFAPALHLLPPSTAGLLGFIPLLLNSLVWGIAIYFIIRSCFARTARFA